MIEDKLIKLLAVKFPGVIATSSLTRQLDSFQIVELVSLIENEFDIQVNDLEVEEENFANLLSLEKFILRKRQSTR